MPHPDVPDDTRRCVWMSAGLLSYRLCDRDFDCERCPLDAALRQSSSARWDVPALLAPVHDAGKFPADRRYTSGHTWVRSAGHENNRLIRLGLDTFAATMLGKCQAVSVVISEKILARHEAICQIDLGLGTLAIGAPLRSRAVDWNRSLHDNPDQLITEPYGKGWIADLIAVNPHDFDGLLTAEAARENARMDLERFRRRTGQQLMAESMERGKTMSDGGELVADLRQVLGGTTYLELLQELIH